MTAREYILKEKRLMERQCRKEGLTPEEWISKYAQNYYYKYASKVLVSCFEGYK